MCGGAPPRLLNGYAKRAPESGLQTGRTKVAPIDFPCLDPPRGFSRKCVRNNNMVIGLRFALLFSDRQHGTEGRLVRWLPIL